ncbi:hypothetical protein [Oceanobacillus profundus]|uniref:hypothetical protein n=1 Tax=Oceanobacillus TaxID=182709 RepID=UPI0026E1D382|nr:hypothetical protein [Oceanobacillus profundus]MDO6450177.1 hypothetical protein [Oceanobacillus profundus]
MKEWKQAFWLAGTEWKNFSKHAVFTYTLCLLYIVIVFAFLPIFEGGTTIVGDILFIVIFLLFPAWIKPKESHVQKISGEIWASPSFIMLQQLPIRKNVIVKSRFIFHSFYSFPFQLTLLLCLYILTPEVRNMGFSAYLAFVIIWLAISIYIGFVLPTSDGGDIINWKTLLGSSLFFILLGAAILTLFHAVLDVGFVEWTIRIAQELPLLSAIVSILLAACGFFYWPRSLKKTMEKLDYL